jgi:hypothetical protein
VSDSTRCPVLQVGALVMDFLTNILRQLVQGLAFVAGLTAILIVNMTRRATSTALIDGTSMSGTIAGSGAPQLGHEDARSPLPFLGYGHVDYDVLMNEALNLALNEDLEKRGVKFARPTREPFTQEGGVSCA